MASKQLPLIVFSLLLATFAFSSALVTASAEDAASPPAAAVDPVELSAYELIREVSLLEEQLSSARRTFRKSMGEEHAVAWVQMLQAESMINKQLDELVEILSELESKSLDVTTIRPTIVELVESETANLQFDIDEIRKQLTTLLERRSKAKKEEQAEMTQQIKEYVTYHNRMLGSFFNNTKRKETLGLETAEDYQVFDELLKKWASELVAHIELIGKEEEALEERFAEALDDDKPAIAAELKIVKARMETGTSSLGLMIGLMKDRGIETSDYSKLLISSTGQITQGIFEKEVAVELISEWLSRVQDWIAENGMSLLFKTVVVLLILLAFRLLAAIIARFVSRAVNNSRLNFSHLLKEFAVKSSRRGVMLLGILVALSQLGIDIGPMLAGLGVAGFVVGFALKDTLSNFASGIMILIYRPFDVGDAVEVDGVTGKVKDMTLVSTTVLTFDNQQLMIPNNNIWGNTIKNITARNVRRVDMTFGIGYGDDIGRAEEILWKIVREHPLVIEEPETIIKVSALGASSVDFIVRPWSKTSDYWDVYWDITRSVKESFDREGISIPFPQSDVHIYREDLPDKA